MRFKRTGETQFRSSKKQKTEPTMVVYRGLKPEMKHAFIGITHVGVAASDTILNNLAAGTAVSNRVGSKIKIWNIEGFVNGASTAALRVDFLVPFDSSATPTHTYNNPVLRTENTLLKTIVMTANAYPNTAGHYFNHKLPLGLVTRYDGPLAANISSNKIVARITAPGLSTVGGYFRIWYTDA